MKKELNLNEYSDREILSALFNINCRKFITLMNGMAVIATSLQKRGEIIAKDVTQIDIDEMFRKIIENEDNNEQ